MLHRAPGSALTVEHPQTYPPLSCLLRDDPAVTGDALFLGRGHRHPHLRRRRQRRALAVLRPRPRLMHPHVFRAVPTPHGLRTLRFLHARRPPAKGSCWRRRTTFRRCRRASRSPTTNAPPSMTVKAPSTSSWNGSPTSAKGRPSQRGATGYCPPRSRGSVRPAQGAQEQEGAEARRFDRAGVLTQGGRGVPTVRRGGSSAPGAGTGRPVGRTGRSLRREDRRPRGTTRGRVGAGCPGVGGGPPSSTGWWRCCPRSAAR